MTCSCEHRLEKSNKKPAWQVGVDADSQDKRNSFKVQADNEKKFSSAFLTLTKTLIDADMKKIMLRAMKRKGATVASIMKEIPFFEPSNKASVVFWKKQAERLAIAYADVIEQTAALERKKYGWKVKSPTKKAKDDIGDFDVPTVPQNPTSIKWIRKKSLTRVVEMSEIEKDRVRKILATNFGKAERVENIVNEIANTVGLTDRQWARVQNKVALAAEKGANDAVLSRLHSNMTEDIRLQRANAIARTEVADAHTQGLLDTWQTADRDGEIEKGTMKEWISFEDARTSQICMRLDGQTVPIDEMFFDEETDQEFEGPPGHPNCRSTMTLVFP